MTVLLDHSSFLWIEVVGTCLEFLGALLLAKEVWDRPSDIVEKFALYRIAEVGALVSGDTIATPKAAEVFVARKSAKKARIGFACIAAGLGLGALAKILEVIHL